MFARCVFSLHHISHRGVFPASRDPSLIVAAGYTISRTKRSFILAVADSFIVDFRLNENSGRESPGNGLPAIRIKTNNSCQMANFISLSLLAGPAEPIEPLMQLWV